MRSVKMDDSKTSIHLGKTILTTLKKYEDETNQIEIISGETETHGSVRLRSIRMAETMKTKGIKKGDVISIAAVNHNDLCIPFLAALYIGAVPLGLTPDMKHLEVKHIISMGQPRMIFADSIAIPTIKNVMKEIGLNADLVVFGEEKIDGCDIFSNFINETGTEESFECEDFDPENSLAVLACSSGTTGLPKLVMLSHHAMHLLIRRPGTNWTDEQRKAMLVLAFSPLYWISGPINILSSCCIGHVRLQSIRPFSPEDFDMASKKYKPTLTLSNQVGLCGLTEYAEKNNVDFPHFRMVFHAGSSVSRDILEKMPKLFPNALIGAAYGCTEIMFVTNGLLPHKMGSCAKPNPHISWKIVDVETEVQLGPNQPGELRLKSPHTFKGYYNNPQATADAFDKDGWYKTGDLMYYDEDGDFYIIDRIKELIKYRNYQVSSVELENVITDIPGVMVAAVVGVSNYEDGEHPMAFVELEPGAEVSAQKIKDYVKENMSDSKQLRAGVVFLDKLPLTYSGKIDRKKLREMKKVCIGE